MASDHHIQEIKLKLEDLQRQLREDILSLDDPQAKALFDTSAEVLQGLYIAFDHYEKKEEPAWEESEVKIETKKGTSKRAEVKGQVGPTKPSSPTHG
ncbi:hypothetical protein [Catalinimonas niigatensis]|uniref:hypothetical protein n=1 Tax=Catalinimonas niigatensis TaxID=1397264 RepID=UPI0026656E5A|nr:hypothetical protein [Catalinimonas niigatensis]WPP49587.1 hypothetical protein PZB72_23215 [Catalinimonas niigatensis]